jgi:hypothetical protein
VQHEAVEAVQQEAAAAVQHEAVEAVQHEAAEAVQYEAAEAAEAAAAEAAAAEVGEVGEVAEDRAGYGRPWAGSLSANNTTSGPVSPYALRRVVMLAPPACATATAR